MYNDLANPGLYLLGTYSGPFLILHIIMHVADGFDVATQAELSSSLIMEKALQVMPMADEEEQIPRGQDTTCFEELAWNTLDKIGLCQLCPDHCRETQNNLAAPSSPLLLEQIGTEGTCMELCTMV